MRGSVLLLAAPDVGTLYADCFRANGLIVTKAAGFDDVLTQADVSNPDIIVVVGVALGPEHASFLGELRRRVDPATSIIATSSLRDLDRARREGADFVLPASALPVEILYEVQRALILRRSGRRLRQ
jgi:DNA-binding response OmpR family regulator